MSAPLKHLCTLNQSKSIRIIGPPVHPYSVGSKRDRRHRAAQTLLRTAKRKLRQVFGHALSKFGIQTLQTAAREAFSACWSAPFTGFIHQQIYIYIYIYICYYNIAEEKDTWTHYTNWVEAFPTTSQAAFLYLAPQSHLGIFRDPLLVQTVVLCSSEAVRVCLGSTSTTDSNKYHWLASCVPIYVPVWNCRSSLLICGCTNRDWPVVLGVQMLGNCCVHIIGVSKFPSRLKCFDLVQLSKHPGRFLNFWHPGPRTSSGKRTSDVLPSLRNAEHHSIRIKCIHCPLWSWWQDLLNVYLW